MPAGQPISAPLLEVLSLCMNRDIGAALFSDAESVRQQAAGYLLDVVKGAQREGPTAAEHGRLVCILFRLLYACLPRSLSRRANSRQYFQLLIDIVAVAEGNEILLFDTQGHEACVCPVVSADLSIPLGGVLLGLAAVLAACPSFERRAAEGPGRGGSDETLAGLARLISWLLPHRTRDASSEEKGNWFAAVGCKRGLVRHLLQSCLYTEGNSADTEECDNRLNMQLQECCRLPGLVGAVTQSCVRAIATVVGREGREGGEGGLDVEGVVAATLRQQAVSLPKAKTEGSRAACENLLKVLCAGLCFRMLCDILTSRHLIPLHLYRVRPMHRGGCRHSTPSDVHFDGGAHKRCGGRAWSGQQPAGRRAGIARDRRWGRGRHGQPGVDVLCHQCSAADVLLD